jgi:PAS domain S-box-containing protein
VRSEPDDRISDLARDGLLAESAEDVYDQAPVAYFTCLLDGTIVQANETLVRWSGRPRDELVGRMRLHDLLPPGARIYYETHYAPLLQMQDEVREIAVELVRADGRRRPVLMTSRLIRDTDGLPRVVRTTAFDATERRRYERELLRARAEAESRARAALALEHVAEAVLLVGEGGELQVLNPAAEALFGVAAAAVIGRKAVDVLDGWGDLAARISVARAAEAPRATVLPLQRGGRELWVSASGSDASGASVYTVRDVTDERALEQMRSDVVTVVSHELRTPLAGALGAAQTLLARYESLSDGDRRSMLEMILEQSRRLAKILDQILLAGQLDSENLSPRFDVFDGTDVVDAVVRAVDAPALSRIVVHAPEGITVRGDLDRLRQVVANVVDNALKYSSGPVRVTLEEREVTARITVADEGPGIPANDQKRVFEKFFRLDPAQRSGVGGTGLGLYIARELAERMGGRIGLLARERGTTVYVDVPLAEGAEARG